MAPTPAPRPEKSSQESADAAGTPADSAAEISRPQLRRPSAPPTSGPVRRRHAPLRSSGGGVRRRRKRRSGILASRSLAVVLVALAALAGVAAGVFGIRGLIARRSSTGELPEGYLADTNLMDREYHRYYRQDLPSRTPARQFDRAAQLARRGNFVEAAGLLESAAGQAAVPVVFNDLGILYARLEDAPRAGSAFRRALSLDARYAAVLANLARLKPLAAGMPALARENEPNNTAFTANLVSVDVPVEGEILAHTADIDFYKFHIPSAPRDVLAVELIPADRKFAPRLDVYDSDVRILDWGARTAPAGQSLTIYGSSDPNTAMYVSVTGAEGTSGRYALTIKPMKAYDEYEPNDDIFHARRVQTNMPIQANIMDREDTDFYSFVAPRTGRVTVEVHNESVTLIPAIQLIGSDLRSKAFGPEVHNPGESLSASLPVEDGQLYYVQIWPQAETSGAYTLTVR